MAVSPSTAISGMPAMREATRGFPAAIASTTTSGAASVTLGRSAMSARQNQGWTRAALPTK